MSIIALILAAATVCLAGIGGLYYAFSCSVMPGLRRTDDQTFVAVMSRINRAIQNPVFALSFGGAFLGPGWRTLIFVGGGMLRRRGPLLSRNGPDGIITAPGFHCPPWWRWASRGPHCANSGNYRLHHPGSGSPACCAQRK